jgi:hypothetical protein
MQNPNDGTRRKETQYKDGITHDVAAGSRRQSNMTAAAS